MVNNTSTVCHIYVDAVPRCGLNITACAGGSGRLPPCSNRQSIPSKCFAGMQDLIDSAVFLDKEDTRIGTVIDVFDGTGKAWDS